MDTSDSSANERFNPPPRRLGRTCDCPCHTGTDIFHIVPCCGSVLGTLLPPVAPRLDTHTDAPLVGE
jgi:hypothetical protein